MMTRGAALVLPILLFLSPDGAVVTAIRADEARTDGVAIGLSSLGNATVAEGISSLSVHAIDKGSEGHIVRSEIQNHSHFVYKNSNGRGDSGRSSLSASDADETNIFLLVEVLGIKHDQLCSVSEAAEKIGCNTAGRPRCTCGIIEQCFPKIVRVKDANQSLHSIDVGKCGISMATHTCLSVVLIFFSIVLLACLRHWIAPDLAGQQEKEISKPQVGLSQRFQIPGKRDIASTEDWILESN